MKRLNATIIRKIRSICRSELDPYARECGIIEIAARTLKGVGRKDSYDMRHWDHDDGDIQDIRDIRFHCPSHPEYTSQFAAAWKHSIILDCYVRDSEDSLVGNVSVHVDGGGKCRVADSSDFCPLNVFYCVFDD